MTSVVPAGLLFSISLVLAAGAARAGTISDPASSLILDPLNPLDVQNYAFFDAGSGGSIFDSGILDLGAVPGSFLFTANTVFNYNGNQQVLSYQVNTGAPPPVVQGQIQTLDMSAVPEPQTPLLLLGAVAATLRRNRRIQRKKF